MTGVCFILLASICGQEWRTYRQPWVFADQRRTHVHGPIQGNVIHEHSGTGDIGAGLTWTDVYKYLTPRRPNVASGRLDGIGVAGLTLGGGEFYSSQQPFHRTNRKGIYL